MFSFIFFSSNSFSRKYSHIFFSGNRRVSQSLQNINIFFLEETCQKCLRYFFFFLYEKYICMFQNICSSCRDRYSVCLSPSTTALCHNNYVEKIGQFSPDPLGPLKRLCFLNALFLSNQEGITAGTLVCRPGG